MPHDEKDKAINPAVNADVLPAADGLPEADVPPEAAPDTELDIDAKIEAQIEAELAAAPIAASAHMTASAAHLHEGETDIRRSDGAQGEKKLKTSRISYERKKKLYGYGFIGLWLVGTIYMFIIPMVMSLIYSMSYTELVDVTRVEEMGMSGPGIYHEWNNFKHYVDAFTLDEKYPVALVESLTTMAPKVALILVFSLFIAVLLNQKFRGRTVMRAIFFLPVLIATGPVISVINGDILNQGVASGAQFSSLFQTDLVDGFLEFMGIYNISEQLTEFVSSATSNILNYIWLAGIQILIFLSALQQVPTSAKEAAAMEGATGWEFFWKITFPTISPMILANLIYSVIDAFVDFENPVMKLVMTKATMLEYGYSAAIAWIYFAIIGAALAIIVAIVSRFVFYQVD